MGLNDIQVRGGSTRQLAGACSSMCAWSRATPRPLLPLLFQIFERVDVNNSQLTSPELAVKRFARTVGVAVWPTMQRVVSAGWCCCCRSYSPTHPRACAAAPPPPPPHRLTTATMRPSTFARGARWRAPWPTSALCWTGTQRCARCFRWPARNLARPPPSLSASTPHAPALLRPCCRTDVRLGLVHKFLWDRYRSVRQDLYIQGMDVSAHAWGVAGPTRRTLR